MACAQLHIGYSILSSIVPCLKNFVSAFEKPYTASQRSESLPLRSSLIPKKNTHSRSPGLDNSRNTILSDESWTCVGEDTSRIGNGNRAHNHESNASRATNAVIIPTLSILSIPSKSTPKLRPEDTAYKAIISSRPHSHPHLHPHAHMHECRAGNSHSRSPSIGTGKGCMARVSDDSDETGLIIHIQKGVEWSVDYDRAGVSPKTACTTRSATTRVGTRTRMTAGSGAPEGSSVGECESWSGIRDRVEEDGGIV